MNRLNYIVRSDRNIGTVKVERKCLRLILTNTEYQIPTGQKAETNSNTSLYRSTNCKETTKGLQKGFLKEKGVKMEYRETPKNQG